MRHADLLKAMLPALKGMADLLYTPREELDALLHAVYKALDTCAQPLEMLLELLQSPSPLPPRAAAVLRRTKLKPVALLQTAAGLAEITMHLIEGAPVLLPFLR